MSDKGLIQIDDDGFITRWKVKLQEATKYLKMQLKSPSNADDGSQSKKSSAD